MASPEEEAYAAMCWRRTIGRLLFYGGVKQDKEHEGIYRGGRHTIFFDERTAMVVIANEQTGFHIDRLSVFEDDTWIRIINRQTRHH
jgi:hypothetical protein